MNRASLPTGLTNQTPPLVFAVAWALFGFSSTGIPATAAEVIVHQAENVDPQPGPVGEKPYEMADRKEERVPLVVFDDVSGWQVEGREAEGWLYRSQDQRLHRDFCAKLVYQGHGSKPSLLVRPQTPIVIPDPWNSVNFWNYGNNWGWSPDPKTPPLEVSVVLRDANAWQLEIPLGSVNYRYWFLMNGRLDDKELGKLKRPVQLLGLRLTGARNSEKRAFYLGPLYFFQEALNPLQFEPWPSELPFPTRPETILPTNKTRDFSNRAVREGKATLFSYKASGCTLEYRYLPVDGTLGDIQLRYKDRVIRPCAGGGLQFSARGGTVSPTDPNVRRTLKAQHLKDGLLTASWHFQIDDVQTEVEYRFRISQKSLIVDIAVDQPVVERVALGRAEPVRDAKLFRLPYLTYGGNDPSVLWADGLFFFNQFDWYVSDASELFGGADLGPDWAVYNGGARYIPKTDGTRNPVRERLLLNVSPDFQEVLPTIPNPKSPFRDGQGDRLWRVKSGADHQAEIDEATQYRKYGCEKVSIRYHEDTWRDAGESFTFRVEAAPQRGGDEALKRFVTAVKALGWRVGLYTNYTDYAPVNKYWNEDWVNRRPNGDWQRAWMRCYAPKPMRAVAMEAKLAPQIHAKFGENHSYCDVHTAVTPFSRVDYDARVPGAGTFRRTFECFGRLLYNEKFAHQGPVYSEGLNHWWYAGLTDGNYAQINRPHPPQEPLLVDFDLLKMHPLQMDAGMGSPGMFFKGTPHNLDQFLATSIAYGHIGFLGEWGMPGDLKSYYMMAQIQRRYAMVPARRIEYEVNQRLVETSRALLSAEWPTNRLHVVYENGTEVFVNGQNDVWAVNGPARTFELPSWGYLVWRPGDDLLTYSAVVPVGGPNESPAPSQRVDCSLGTEQFYADSRGGFVFLGQLALDGTAALKKDAGAWWVIPTTEFVDFAFTPALLKARDKETLEVVGYAEDGSTVGAPTLRWSRGMLHVIPAIEKAFKYKVSIVEGRRPPRLACKHTRAVLGKVILATVPAGATVDAGSAFWEVEGKRHAAGAKLEGSNLTCQVPGDVKPGSHLWLAIPSRAGLLWLDFIAVGVRSMTR